MTAIKYDYTILACPMPTCSADLHVTWTLRRPLFVGDIDEGEPVTNDPFTGTWRVRCEEGHVILVPGSAGCPECNDDDCEHSDFDIDDDLRRFRVRDLGRLRAVLDALSASTETAR